MNTGDQVVVDSHLVPDYNGLTGTIIVIKTHPVDVTLPAQFKVRADPTPANNTILEKIGSPYLDLARPWDFWFVEPELKPQNA